VKAGDWSIEEEIGMYRIGFGICGIDSGDTAEIWYELHEKFDVTDGGEISCVILCETTIFLDADCSVVVLEKNGTKLNGRRKDGLCGITTCIFGRDSFDS
jgi:hypothetical protein